MLIWYLRYDNGIFCDLGVIASKFESTKETTESSVGECKKTNIEESAGRKTSSFV